MDHCRPIDAGRMSGSRKDSTDQRGLPNVPQSKPEAQTGSVELAGLRDLLVDEACTQGLTP